MDLQPRTTVFTPQDEKAWLGSTHGTDCTRSVTLDLAGGGFGPVTRNGYVRSGTAIRRLASGLYGIATGADVADGHLYESVLAPTGATQVGGAILWHGVVIDAQVPGTFVDANRAPKHILYV